MISCTWLCYKGYNKRISCACKECIFAYDEPHLYTWGIHIDSPDIICVPSIAFNNDWNPKCFIGFTGNVATVYNFSSSSFYWSKFENGKKEFQMFFNSKHVWFIVLTIAAVKIYVMINSWECQWCIQPFSKYWIVRHFFITQ